MKIKITIMFFLFFLVQQARSQNWAPVPCYNGAKNLNRGALFVDSLKNELILNYILESNICSVNFKSILAYNGNEFHDLDFGLNKYNPNPYTSGDRALACIPYNGKTLYGGFFASVGSNTLYSEAMALWNGAVWDTFPKFTFMHNPSRTGHLQLVNGFLQDNGKIWIYGDILNIGGIAGKNIYSFDGNNFTAYNIPVSHYEQVVNMIKYKNQIYALGAFYDYPNNTISAIAKFDGNTWTSVGNGIIGSLDNASELAIYRDTLYIAGSFSKASGNVGNYIMKWDGNQLYDAGFGGFYGWGRINKLLVFRNRLYAFGNFDHAIDKKAFGVAYYENGQWLVPQDSIAGNINTAAIFRDEIYIGGSFLSIDNNLSIKFLAKLQCPDFDIAAGCVSGLKKSSKKLDVKFFPNPSNDRLHLEFEQSTNIDKISIINTLGQEVYKLMKPVSRQEINISQLPTGIYLLKAENKEGQGVFKFLKE